MLAIDPGVTVAATKMVVSSTHDSWSNIPGGIITSSHSQTRMMWQTFVAVNEDVRRKETKVLTISQ